MNFNFKFLLSCLYFFLPAYFANMAPPIAKRLKILESFAVPVDFNKKLFGKPVFGNHKTWRGIIVSLFSSLFAVFLQRLLFSLHFFRQISLLNYSQKEVFFFGFLMGFGQILGDLTFAFIKRRLNLPPGSPFFPFDQTNYVIGNFFILQPIFKLPLSFWLTLFIFTFFLHIFVNRLGYHLKIHQAKW